MGWLLATLAALTLTLAGTRSEEALQPFPLYLRLMHSPDSARDEADRILQRSAAAAHSPTGLFQMLGELGGAPTLERPSQTTVAGASPQLADTSALPEPLRGAMENMLVAIGRADHALQHALRAVPAIDPAALRAQALEGAPAGPDDPDFRDLLKQLDRATLLQGMQDLVAATGQLRDFVQSHPDLPPLRWDQKTALGQVIVNTRIEDNQYTFDGGLLFVLDTSGNDHYRFTAQRPHGSLSVLLDLAGNDRYVATAPCADPSCATLGYGILWDAAGDDEHEGGELAQASALLGAALLVDEAGDNRFSAQSHAQAHAIGGYALLRASPGRDQWQALTHAQASAGPQGVAMLVDPGGDDHYTLSNAPLQWPSPQLSTHNTSMGQGAGRGYRAGPGVANALSGGLGLLVDLGGDDHYTAQVFAQGVGYYQGIGMLLDAAGTDRFDAAWYAMGASAHEAAGVLVKKGSGNDRYAVLRSTGLGAAHDASMAFFLDEDGDDRYQIETFGLGFADEESMAIFRDAGGHNLFSCLHCSPAP